MMIINRVWFHVLQVVPNCDEEEEEEEEDEDSKSKCKHNASSHQLSPDAVAGVCKNTIRQLHSLQVSIFQVVWDYVTICCFVMVFHTLFKYFCFGL